MVEISHLYGVYPNKMNVTSRKAVYAKQVPPKVVDLQAKQATSVASENTPSVGKMLLGLGVGILALGGAILAKKVKTSEITHAFEAIDAKFSKLEQDLPQVTETFKNVFLRKDLTEKETKEILNRYKEIEKLGVTGTKEAYAEALFTEAKNNYGLADVPGLFALRMKELPRTNIGQIAGTTTPYCVVTVHSGQTKKSLLNTIHHELRHAKQKITTWNYAPEKYVEYNQPKNMKLTEKDFTESLGKSKGVASMTEEEIQMAKNTLENYKNYVSAKKNYKANRTLWVEEDAYNVGNTMENLLG